MQMFFRTVRDELGTILTEVPNADILLHDTLYQSPESGHNIGPYRVVVDVLKETRSNYSLMSTQRGLPRLALLYQLRKQV
jgi:hypothetical protein